MGVCLCVCALWARGSVYGWPAREEGVTSSFALLQMPNELSKTNLCVVIKSEHSVHHLSLTCTTLIEVTRVSGLKALIFRESFFLHVESRMIMIYNGKK